MINWVSSITITLIFRFHVTSLIFPSIRRISELINVFWDGCGVVDYTIICGKIRYLWVRFEYLCNNKYKKFMKKSYMDTIAIAHDLFSAEKTCGVNITCDWYINILNVFI